jgi:cytochrome c-type biogenesis protein
MGPIPNQAANFIKTETRNSKIPVLISFLLPAIAVFAFLFLLINLRNGAEAAVVSLAGLLPIGYAFTGGMVASVNPCGFFMLPSYVSYQLGAEESGFYESPLLTRFSKALLVGAVTTLGFIVVFAAIGAIITAGGYWLITIFPYTGVAIGAAMIGLGLWILITHGTLGIMSASRIVVTPKRNLANVFLFGMGYGICSLSCTLPVFLVVVGSALATRGFFESFGQFIGYALGMGSILVAVTIGSALFRGTVARWLRGVIPYVHRISGLFLLGAGAYLIYYWVFYADFFF